MFRHSPCVMLFGLTILAIASLQQAAAQQQTMPQQQAMAPRPTLLAQGPLARLAQRGRLGIFSQTPPDYVGVPRQLSLGTPGPHRFEPPASQTPHQYPEYERAQSYWYGYGFGVPTYNWGSFGVRYRPHSSSHHGYHNDYTQWGFRRGY